MASSVVKPTKPANAAASGATQPGSRKSTNFMIFATVIVGLVCVQIVVTSLLMPGPAHSPINQRHAKTDQAAAHQPDSEHETAKAEFAEVTMGDFSFSNTTAVRGVVTHVDFRLAALASPSQVSTLESQLRSNQGRIREAINKIVRNCNLDELNDPNLEAIKRQVREDVNELLGKRLIIDLMINDVRVIQQ